MTQVTLPLVLLVDDDNEKRLAAEAHAASLAQRAVDALQPGQGHGSPNVKVKNEAVK